MGEVGEIHIKFLFLLPTPPTPSTPSTPTPYSLLPIPFLTKIAILKGESI